MSRDAASAWALFLGVFCVYLRCAYPVFSPRDSADLALAALTLGVAHPPGYPFYALLGKAWILAFPFGDPSYRLNALSAAAGAAAAAAAFVLVRRRGLGPWPALGAALALAFSAPLWKFSLLGEKYSLHALFALALLALAEGEARTLRARASASALALGLGLVNHQSLVLLVPALALLWRGELARHGARAAELARALPFLLLGLSLQAAVALRLRDAGLALAVTLRAEYGTLELFGGFARPMTGALAAGLLGHLAAGLWGAGTPLLAALAALGAWEASRREPRWAAALGLVLLAFGPAFFLMTRFDLSEWVARSVLEPAFLLPTAALSLFAAWGIAALERRRRAAGPILALALALWGAWSRGASASRRDDYSAYDYARAVRAAIPPGTAAVVGGDTALFGLRYLEAREPSGRRLIGSREPLLKEIVASELARGPLVLLGLPLEALEGLGLLGAEGWAVPAGLVQRARTRAEGLAPREELLRAERLAWEAASAARPSRALRSGESYAHDIRLSHAFAHYLSGLLYERLRLGDPSAHFRAAAAIDPEDYQLVAP